MDLATCEIFVDSVEFKTVRENKCYQVLFERAVLAPFFCFCCLPSLSFLDHCRRSQDFEWLSVYCPFFDIGLQTELRQSI